MEIGEFELNKIYCVDCLEGMKKLPDNSVDLIITSPPYNQNLTTQDLSMSSYKDNKNEDEYIDWIKQIFIEFNRILKDNGSVFYNYKTDVKDNKLRTAFEHLLKVKGKLFISAEIVWKYAGNFDSGKNRFPTDYEMIYHLTKTPNYYFKHGIYPLSSVWRINHVMAGTIEKKKCGNHPCPFPLKLIRKCIEHTTDEGMIVMDPFMGSGTTAEACKEMNRKFIGFEIDPNYCKIAEERLKQKILW